MAVTFDANGNRVTETSPLGNVDARLRGRRLGKTHSRDRSGRKVTTVEFDADGFLVAETDRLGRRTTYNTTWQGTASRSPTPTIGRYSER